MDYFDGKPKSLMSKLFKLQKLKFCIMSKKAVNCYDIYFLNRQKVLYVENINLQLRKIPIFLPNYEGENLKRCMEIDEEIQSVNF